jgi:chaperonin cofactor prefoldin
MKANQDSVDSQLRTKFNVLESQVETLEKQKSKSFEKFVINDDA